MIANHVAGSDEVRVALFAGAANCGTDPVTFDLTVTLTD